MRAEDRLDAVTEDTTADAHDVIRSVGPSDEPQDLQAPRGVDVGAAVCNAPRPMEGAETRPLDVGEVIQQAFRTVGQNVGVFLAIGVFTNLPGSIAGVFAQVAMFELLDPSSLMTADPASLGPQLAAMFAVYFAMLLILMALSAIGHGAAVYAAVEHLVGRKASIGEAMRVGLARFFWVFLCMLLVGMVSGFGFMFCIVPGVVAWVWLCVAAPAVIIENMGPVQAMQRSVDLTEGHRVPIFLAYLVLTLAYMGFAFCIVGPVSVLSQAGTTPGELPDPLSPGQLVMAGLNFFVAVAVFMVFTALNGVIYARLRGLRDGVDASALAQVFT